MWTKEDDTTCEITWVIQPVGCDTVVRITEDGSLRITERRRDIRIIEEE